MCPSHGLVPSTQQETDRSSKSPPLHRFSSAHCFPLRERRPEDCGCRDTQQSQLSSLSSFQASACVTSANTPLARASHMVKSKVKGQESLLRPPCGHGNSVAVSHHSRDGDLGAIIQPATCSSPRSGVIVLQRFSSLFSFLRSFLNRRQIMVTRGYINN